MRIQSEAVYRQQGRHIQYRGDLENTCWKSVRMNSASVHAEGFEKFKIADAVL